MKNVFMKRKVMFVFVSLALTFMMSSCRGSSGKNALKATGKMIERVGKSAKKSSSLVINCSDDVARHLDLRKVKCEKCGGDGTTWYFTKCKDCSGRGYNYAFKLK